MIGLGEVGPVPVAKLLAWLFALLIFEPKLMNPLVLAERFVYTVLLYIKLKPIGIHV
jgi:hypothetical protein